MKSTVGYMNISEPSSYPRDINIHVPLRGELFHFSMNINDSISKYGDNEISFSPLSPYIPHISVFRGAVESANQLSDLLVSISGMSAAISGFEVVSLAPYVRGDFGPWIFSDLRDSSEFRNLQDDVCESVTKLHIRRARSAKTEIPHITLGYILDSDGKVRSELERYSRETRGRVDALEVSFAGPRGTCIGSIRSFELR